MELFGEIERVFAAAIYPNRVLVAIVAVAIVVATAVVARRRRWDLMIRRHPRRAVIGAVVAILIGAPAAVYVGSPLIVSTTIDEPPPVAAAEPSPARATPAPSVPLSPTPTAVALLASPSPAPTAPPVERIGTLTGADEFHFGRGMALLIETAPGAFTVRLEGFEVRNGPDLYVYLSPDPAGYVEGAVEVGRLKADRGNQNYEVPAGTDVSGAASVVIWCKQFSVLFATATLR